MRDDMSAKLVEHDEMSANLEKENELLRTTYAKCIEEEINNLRKMTCGTCERLKSQNEVFAHKVQESVPRVWILAFLVTPMLMLLNLLLLKRSRLLLLSLSLWMVLSVLVLWIALP
jgi:hypothetical protein